MKSRREEIPGYTPSWTGESAPLTLRALAERKGCPLGHKWSARGQADTTCKIQEGRETPRASSCPSTEGCPEHYPDCPFSGPSQVESPMVDQPVLCSSFKPCGILNSRSVGALLDKCRTFYKVRSAKETSVLVHATETFKRSYFLPLPFREEESCLSTPGMPEQGAHQKLS